VQASLVAPVIGIESQGKVYERHLRLILFDLIQYSLDVDVVELLTGFL